MLHSDAVITTTQFVLSGLIVGIVIAAPVGPVNIVCIQRTLERGFWGGFAAGIGAVLADGLIATVAAFGITAISGILADHKFAIQLVGGAIMIGFGVKLFNAEPKLAPKQRVTSLAQLRRIVEGVPERLQTRPQIPDLADPAACGDHSADFLPHDHQSRGRSWACSRSLAASARCLAVSTAISRR